MQTFKSSANLKNDEFLAKLKFQQAGISDWQLDPNISGKYSVTFKNAYIEPPLINYNIIVKNGAFDVAHQLVDVTEKGFVVYIQNGNLSEPVSGVLRWQSLGQ